MASMFADVTVCKVCCKKVIDKGVECDGNCKRWFHPSCVQLSASEYKKIADGTIKSWTCGRVDCCSSSSDPYSKTLDTILMKIDALATKDDLRIISNDIASLREDISNMSLAIADITPRLAQVESEVVTMKNDISKLKSEDSAHNLEDFCSEVSDRLARKANIILRNIPESSSSSPDDKKTHDHSLISRIFDLVHFKPSKFSFFRLGKMSVRSPRTVKVILPNADSVKEFFSKFSQELLTDSSISKVTASRDRTLQERKHLDELREELDRRTGNGERDLTIKFINNTPRIIKKSKN